MSEAFYYMKEGQRYGPISFSELKQLFTSGQLRPDAQIWKDDKTGWQPASKVPGLLPPRPPVPAAIIPRAVASPASVPNAVPPPAPVANVSPVAGSKPPVPVLLLSLVGGGCFVVGLVLGLLLGGSSGGPGGSIGGSGSHPGNLVGQWERPFLFGTTLTLELKSNGEFVYQVTSKMGGKWTGNWKVESVVDGKYKIHITYDDSPDRTYGWVITFVDENQIRLEGHDIGDPKRALKRKK